MEALGKHILVEYYQCSEKVLNDPSFVEEAMTSAAKLAGATIINSTTHHFSPWGVSCVVVIQESHLSIHTWPEFKFASVDLYTCGGSVDPWIGFKSLSKAFETTNYSVIEMKRGLRHMLPEATHLFEVEDIEKEYNKPAPDAVIKRNTWFQELSVGNGLGNSIKTV
jgi:spermidine synthase